VSKKVKNDYVSYDFIALNYVFGVPAIQHLKAFKILSKTHKIDVLITEQGVLASARDISKLQTYLAMSVLLN